MIQLFSVPLTTIIIIFSWNEAFKNNYILNKSLKILNFKLYFFFIKVYKIL